MTERVHLDSAGFGIAVPCSWRVHTDVPGLALVAILPDQRGTRDNIGVIVEDTGQPTPTLEQYMTFGIERAPQHIDRFRVLERATRATATATQGLVEYTGLVRGHQRRFLAVTVLGEGVAFTATYAATERTFQSHRRVADAVLQTLSAR